MCVLPVVAHAEVTETLQSEGVVSFAASFDDLLATLDEKRAELASV